MFPSRQSEVPPASQDTDPWDQAGAVSPVREDGTVGQYRAHSACRSGSGVEGLASRSARPFRKSSRSNSWRHCGVSGKVERGVGEPRQRRKRLEKTLVLQSLARSFSRGRGGALVPGCLTVDAKMTGAGSRSSTEARSPTGSSGIGASRSGGTAARPVVEAALDEAQPGVTGQGQVGALGQVLADKAVGVLVGAALPGALGVAEEDGHA